MSNFEKLEAVWEFRGKIIAAEERYREWKMRAETTVVVLKEKPHTGNHENWRENAILEMAEAYDSYLDCVSDYIGALREAYMVLDSLDNPDWYTVLCCRHIRGRTWKEIAEDMKCSTRSCQIQYQQARNYLMDQQ